MISATSVVKTKTDAKSAALQPVQPDVPIQYPVRFIPSLPPPHSLSDGLNLFLIFVQERVNKSHAAFVAELAKEGIILPTHPISMETEFDSPPDGAPEQRVYLRSYKPGSDAASLLKELNNNPTLLTQVPIAELAELEHHAQRPDA